ncbi:MAG TPA: MarR family transcriptional regulator [Candidatus Kapabacteria bacterium]|jgi:DNA-binding MarR family transcriptional regulator
MGEILKQRLKMSKFESPVQEATLALMAAASGLRVNFDRTLAEVGLSGEQFNILRILRGAGKDGHPSGEIGCRMVDRSPDITRRIDSLEKEGMVERERSTTDRRVVRVHITKKGLDVLNELQPKLKAFDTKLAANMSDIEFKHLSQLCEKIIEVENKVESE